MTGFRLVSPMLGVAAFVYSPMLGAMVAETADTKLTGSAPGITSSVWQLGSTVVPLAVGVVFASTGSLLAGIIALVPGPAFAIELPLREARQDRTIPVRPA